MLKVKKNETWIKGDNNTTTTELAVLIAAYRKTMRQQRIPADTVDAIIKRVFELGIKADQKEAAEET